MAPTRPFRLLTGGRGWSWRGRDRRPMLCARATPSPICLPRERDALEGAPDLEGVGLEVADGSVKAPPRGTRAEASTERCLARRGGLLGALPPALGDLRRRDALRAAPSMLGERGRRREPREEEEERDLLVAPFHDEMPEDRVPDEKEAASNCAARPAVASR